MNAKKILLSWALIAPMLWVSALTYASDSTTTTSTCTVDMATVKTILEKQKAWTTLTTEETATLESAKSCKQWGSKWNAPEMTDEQKAQMETIKALQAKKAAWTTLTTEEEATLTAWEANKPTDTKNDSTKTEMTDEQKAQMETIKALQAKKAAWTTLTTEEEATLTAWEANKPTDTKKDTTKTTTTKKTTTSKSNLSDTSKTKLNTTASKFFSKLSSLDTEAKLEKLTTLKTKLTALNTTLASDSTQATYVEMISYIIELVQAQIDEVSWSDDSSSVDSLINSLIN